VEQFVSTAVSNVARTCGTTQNEPCITSSDAEFFLYPGSYGNDGNDDGNFVHIEALTVGTNIVFMIDFGKEQIIQFIMFYNRNEDCCRNRPNGASIRVGPTSAWAASTACAVLNSQSVQTFDCNLQGQYIFIVLPVLTQPTILNFYEFKAFSACSRCPAFSSSPQASILSTSCVCNSGFIGQNGGICSECAAGKYKMTAQTCTDCPAGKFSSTVALNTISGCISCEKGKFAEVPGLLQCKQCEPGKYQESTNQLHCELCPTGQASGNGFSSCVLCDSGKYWAVETSSCTLCVWPKYKTQVGSAMCESCQVDSVFIAADTECTNLTACMQGYYNEHLNCLRCPHNHTTPTSSAIYYRESCICLPGFEKITDVECTPCIAGFYSPFIGSSCIQAPRGTFVQYIGSTLYQTCAKNWISPTTASKSCTPCPYGTFSSPENTFCVPGDENSLTSHIKQQFKLSVFCVDVNSFGLKTGFVSMEKNSHVSWDSSKEIINTYYSNFVSDRAHFSTPFCDKAYLYSTPSSCGLNMFMMRTHSYIWECVRCPIGMYKNTFSVLYADCNPCSNNFCPQVQQACQETNGIHLTPQNPTYSNYFKHSYL
jgi:hypothetical protein